MSELKVIKQSFEVLDQNTPMTKKVGRMARICYRSEANADDESDARLIKNCIKNGHTSVCEHGMMSIFFGNNPINPELFGDPNIKNPIPTVALWNQFHSPEISKYTETYVDDQIYKIVDGSNATPHPYPVILANFRAWHNILDQCMVAATEQGFPIGVAFICGIITSAAKEFPAVFGDLVDKTNEAFKMAPAEHYLCKLFKPEGVEHLEITHLAKYYDNFEIYVAPATPRASLSVILRTDRAVTHQLVRHRRDVAYSQESQRYCNYNNKGYEVIWPSMDPIRYKNYTLKTPEDTNVKLNDDGTIPENSAAFKSWKESMTKSVEAYEYLSKELVLAPVEGAKEGTEEAKPINISPETARGVLPNSFATTIGVTWTPATFFNLMHWRIDEHAQWPIRQLIGDVVIDALKQHHEFFENYPPTVIINWINKIASQRVTVDNDLIKGLIAYQEKRQQNISMQMEAMRKRIEAQREAQKKAEEEAKKADEAEKKANAEKPTPKMGEPVGPSTEKK